MWEKNQCDSIMRHLGIADTGAVDEQRPFILPIGGVIRAQYRCRIQTNRVCSRTIVTSDGDSAVVQTTSLDASVMLLGYVPVFDDSGQLVCGSKFALTHSFWIDLQLIRKIWNWITRCTGIVDNTASVLACRPLIGHATDSFSLWHCTELLLLAKPEPVCIVMTLCSWLIRKLIHSSSCHMF